MEEKQSDKQQINCRRPPLQQSIAFRASFLTADDLDLDTNDNAVSAISTTGDDVDSDVAANIDVSVSGLCADNVFDEDSECYNLKTKANTALYVQEAVDATFHVSRSSILSRQVSCASTVPSSRSIISEEIAAGLGCPHEMAGRAAIQVHQKFVNSLPPSLKFDFDHRDTVAPFQTKEIILGKLLGSGEFSHVYEINEFRPVDHIELDETSSTIRTLGLVDAEIAVRKLMKKRERYRHTNKASYAVKHLRPVLLEKYDVEKYIQAATDLAMEAEFLNSLSDPNIIKLRGISFAGPGGFSHGPKGYFIILDRLDETLADRIKRWKKQKNGPFLVGNVRELGRKAAELGRKALTASMLGSETSTVRLTRSNSATNVVLEDQLDVGLQLSSALAYLHEKNIIFRDLKPANVGFDVRGDVKLFDFGLASFMSQDGDPYEDEYEMSGAGSPRYMAPEVLVNPPKPYNMKVDVYSFGIVLWEIISLQKPFGHVTSQDELVDYVTIQGGRPAINDEWKEPVKETLASSFSADSTARPTIRYCYDFLRQQLIEHRDGDASQLNDTYIKRRRSQASMQLELSLHAHNYQKQMNKEKTIGHKVSAAMTAVKSVAPISTLRNELRQTTKKEEE